LLHFILKARIACALTFNRIVHSFIFFLSSIIHITVSNCQNARIVLDEFQTVLHSPGSIASVGVIHPLTFHLENKETAISLSNNDKSNYSSLGKNGSVFEVQGDCPPRNEATCQSNAERTNLVEVSDDRIYISRTKKDNIFSICCWLQDSCKKSAGKH